MDFYTFMLTDTEEEEIVSQEIVDGVTSHSSFFHDNIHCAGREGISPLLKCTSAVRQLAYGVGPDFLDEYLQMSERTSRLSFDHFCNSIMEIFGPEYLRKPTVADVVKLYRHHEEKHGRGNGPNPFILLEVVVSHDLWIWHAFFGVVGSNNDINVLHQSPLFNDPKTGQAPNIPFVANDVTYIWGYYLVDGIYPELTTLVKTIT
uniref:Protein ALP1-like n=1 Tax=Tanacetum cinerariifolium TaxID=118510 RepID=A0A6L2LY74_TANCI|nr:hypothetical protein [Tanacetum cinerariifolium]